MSAPKRPGYASAEPAEEKSLFDDDLDHHGSLSYRDHPRTPLNRSSEHSTRPTPSQHDTFVGGPVNMQVSSHEGLPSQVHLDSHPQKPSHPAGRNQSWDLLGEARKLGQGYERFDPRNTSEQHLAFADGDLPKSKASASWLL